MLLDDEITSPRQNLNIGNNEKDQYPFMFDEENFHSLNLDPFQFSQLQDYFESSTLDDQNNISTVNIVDENELSLSWVIYKKKVEDEHNNMQYLNTDNEISVLNNQTEGTPTTLLGNQPQNLQDEPNYAKYFDNNTTGRILDDLN